MKKRILTLALALIMIISLLPMTALADGPTVALTFNNSVSASVKVTVAPGDTVYITTDENAQFVKWEDTEAPADKFVKIEYTEGDSAIMNVTFNNINANCGKGENYHRYGIHFPAGEYAVVLNLVGENKIENTKSSCIKLDNGLDNTITGAGSLSLTNIGDPHGALWSNAGDLLIKDTTINFTVTPGNSSMHHAILATKGSVTLDGVKFETKTQGGYQVFFGKAQATGDRDGRYTLDTDTERKLVIKNSDILFDSGSKTAFKTASAATISNSTLKLLTSAGEGPLFSPAPTFEGEYTAIAGLKKNAEKPEKLKVYDPKKLNSYSYIYIVPGKVDLLPTEAPTEAPTTEATEAPTVEATQPTTGENDATKPTTGNNNEATKPTTGNNEVAQPTTGNKDENKNDATDDATEEQSGNSLKIVLIVMIVLAVATAGAVGVIFYLRNKGAASENEAEEVTEESETEE